MRRLELATCCITLAGTLWLLSGATAFAGGSVASPTPLITVSPVTTPMKLVNPPPVKATKTRLGYFHVCPVGYHLPNGGGLSGYLVMASPVMCVR